MDFKDKIKHCILRLLSFESINSKSLLILNFFLFLFLFDVSKAENKDVNISEDNQSDIEYSSPRGEQENLIPGLAKINPMFKDENKKNLPINIDYLEPKNELEDYIVDTGDTLFIEFENKPRGFQSIESTYDPKNISYLNPRNDLRNYKLDEGDVLDIKFIYVPEFNSIQRIDTEDGKYPIDQEGEIYLPELGSVYLRGLTIYQVKDLLEKKYDEYLKFPEMEIRIESFRFIKSGKYTVNNEGEIYLPLLDEIYVRGLTTSEISNLLSRKYINSERIYAEIETRIVDFKPQKILISGEVRNPGIYKFPAYSSFGEFVNEEKRKSIQSNQLEIEINPNVSASELRGGDNLNRDRFNSNESNLSLNQNPQNNNIRQNFQIKSPSENFTTISNAIRRAGGITSKTDLSRIEITREVPIGKGGGKKRALVNFTSFLNGNDTSNDIRLFDGDKIFLPKLALSSPEIIPKSILSGLSPKFITVDIFGRVENPGSIMLPLEASLSDAIDLTGPIKPLSGKIVLIRYNKDGTILKKNISYSSRAKRGSKRNPYVKEGDLISIKNSFFGKSTGVLREITAPFIGIYTTKEVIESFND